MEKKTVEYIPASEIFDGLDTLWESLPGSSDMTWGDGDHSLFALHRVIAECENIAGEGEENADTEYATLLERVGELSPDTLIDLES